MRVEVAQQEIGGQEIADFAQVIVEADHVDALVGLEFIGLLGQERQLDAVAQVGVATPRMASARRYHCSAFKVRLRRYWRFWMANSWRRRAAWRCRPATVKPACATLYCFSATLAAFAASFEASTELLFS